jgi:hypothetical protein
MAHCGATSSYKRGIWGQFNTGGVRKFAIDAISAVRDIEREVPQVVPLLLGNKLN